jgi:peptidoglycan L-alanyl-D-glutamate endopeptidase CwlK
VDRDLAKLAPQFREQVIAAIAECRSGGLDAILFEGWRSPELQALYYARGRTIIPPTKPVTYARSNLESWHGFGLAVDVISQSKGWDQPMAWFLAVAVIFKQHGCKWGGDWRRADPPHHQWGPCKPSPSDRARELYAGGGVQAVWIAVGAA